MFHTQAGEYSIKVLEITMLGKNIRPLPAVKEKLEDGKLVPMTNFPISNCTTQALLDLLLNPDTVRCLRRGQDRAHAQVSGERGFIEVEALCCNRFTEAPMPASPITTLWMWTSICGSPPSCISNASSWRV